MFSRSNDLEARVNDAVGLHGGDGDIEAPEEDKDTRGNSLKGLRTSELSAHSRVSPGHEDQDGEAGLDTEHSHREAQAGTETMMSEEITHQTSNNTYLPTGTSKVSPWDSQ